MADAGLDLVVGAGFPIARMNTEKRFRTVFRVPDMDCLSEENMVKMALQGVDGIESLSFELPQRRMTAVHRGPASELLQRLEPLGFGATLVETESARPERRTQTILSIPKMDCASEENMIRMALQGVAGVQSLSFDLGQHRLTAVHYGPADELLERLEPLGLGATLVHSAAQSSADPDEEIDPPDNEAEARLLKLLLGINAAMFLVEIAVGFWAQSTSLIADSLDMFADAAVYGLSLYAVGRSAALKTKAAHTAGWLQLALALLALAEVARRFAYGSEPVSELMMGMGFVALLANATCLVLVAKKRNAGAHMKASYIFSSNDVIANAGVILAGVLVAVTGSPYPDLIVGLLVGCVVLNGARRILKLR
jgi:copper chaperone CopZ